MTDTEKSDDSGGEQYFETADAVLEESYDEPLSLDEFISRVCDDPSIASTSEQYVLDAIEAAGTRTVTVCGNEVERYRFFDDPWNGGENAVVGNTRVLNEFVEDLRMIASEQGKEEKMLWVVGPTGTGKSEFKRCLINGLQEYSKTDAGRRYTVEWNLNGVDDVGYDAMTYGQTEDVSETDWYRSPIQTSPLSVFPEEVRDEIVADIVDSAERTVAADADIDPFSREAYVHLTEQYRDEYTDSLFSTVTDSNHCRVVNYVVEPGAGIGVLNPEDSGSAKELLVGSWMPDMFDETDSRGRKNPQAFSYDGLLSQGNAGLSIVEEAGQRANLIGKLFTVPDEGTVKLDKGIDMDVDTTILLISNPDLEDKLDVGSNNGRDGLRAVKRRLQKHELSYLTTVTDEAQLLRREILGETDVWADMEAEELSDNVRAGSETTVAVTGGAETRELAPHTIEAAAVLGVSSRFITDPDDVELDTIDSVLTRVLLYDTQLEPSWGTKYDMEDVDGDVEDIRSIDDGEFGIPVTVMRDIIGTVLQDGVDREHPELDVGSVIMPDDILKRAPERLASEPMFGKRENRAFEARIRGVREYIRRQQEADVIDAMLAEKRVGEDGIEDYLKHVYAWVTDEDVGNGDGGTIEPDPFHMKVFETERFGLFSDGQYDGTEPDAAVRQWRKEEIVDALKSSNYDSDNGGSFWHQEDVVEKLHTYGWEHVYRIFEDFDETQWEDPPEGSQTEQIKEQTIEHLVENGYTEASAELTTRAVFPVSDGGEL